MKTQLELRKLQNDLMIKLINSKSAKRRNELRAEINKNEKEFETRFGYRCIEEKKYE